MCTNSTSVYITPSVQVFMRMGIPQVVVSDQGREFNNALDDELAALLGITRRLTTPYHPQVWSYNVLLHMYVMYMY